MISVSSFPLVAVGDPVPGGGDALPELARPDKSNVRAVGHRIEIRAERFVFMPHLRRDVT
ncbi:MAG: hypothetical protein ACE5KS_06830 [Woeseiaceae bacterium]